MSGYAVGAPLSVSGGAAAPAWQLITGWGSLNDAAAQADVGSGMSAGTGTIVTKAGEITIIDGYQESWVGWDTALTTLFPDWSDTTDRLELCLEIASMPLGLDKWGLGVWVADNTYANRATAAAKGAVVFPNSVTVTQAGEVGPTANQTASNNGSNTNIPLQMYVTLTWDAGGVPRCTARVKRTNDEQEISVVQSPPAAMGAAANRRICLAILHYAATGAARTVSARVYARRVRTTGPFV